MIIRNSLNSSSTECKRGRKAPSFAFCALGVQRNWKIVAELENVAKELDRSMAQVAVNWTANQPCIGSVIIGATKLSQLEDNLKALDFEIPQELRDRLEAVSRPESQFPYIFFESKIQGMVNGGKSVGLKPSSYYP